MEGVESVMKEIVRNFFQVFAILFHFILTVPPIIFFIIIPCIFPYILYQYNIISTKMLWICFINSTLSILIMMLLVRWRRFYLIQQHHWIVGRPLPPQ